MCFTHSQLPWECSHLLDPPGASAPVLGEGGACPHCGLTLGLHRSSWHRQQREQGQLSVEIVGSALHGQTLLQEPRILGLE